MTQQTPVLEAHGISKSFGHVRALEDVSIELFPSEILGLVGDNGAGKSTLIKILSGAYLPDHGEIKLHGKPVVFHDPGEARHAGIETVYQDLALAPHLEVAANVFLGREIPRTGLLGQFGFLDHPAMRRQAAQQLRDLRVNVKSIRQTVNQLSGGQRQSVAVARAVSWGKDIIIMDEPTAALGVAQAGMVLELILRVKQAGVSVILISHNMPHVFQVADRMIVLRQGRRVATVNPHEVSMEHVVSLMTGAVTIGGHVAGGG
jgi:fructose transport system ATP-binding protein